LLRAYQQCVDPWRYRGKQSKNEMLLIRWVSLRDAFRIRRIYRRFAERKGSGSLRRMTVFVRHENVLRLFKFLGYCLE
jgi:hypothetical protein